MEPPAVVEPAVAEPVADAVALEILPDAAADAEPATEATAEPAAEASAAPPERKKKRRPLPVPFPARGEATTLWRAAEHGDVARLKRLLDARGDVNSQCSEPGWRQKSVLSAAVDGNEPAAVRLLLRRGADPNRQDGDGDRWPLHWASAFGDHAECASLLVQARAALDVVDHGGRTPLEFARSFSASWFGLGGGRPQVVALLERAAAAPARGGWTHKEAKEVLSDALWTAASKGDLETIERQLSRGVPVDAKCPNATAPLPALSIAVYHDQRDAVRLLLSRGADANARDGRHGMAPLHYAAHAVDRAECAQLLLDAGADVFAAKHDGETAAAFAQRMAQPRVLALLDVAGARARAADGLRAAMAPGWLLPVSAAQLTAALDAARAAGVEDEALLAAAEEARAGATGAGWDWGTLVAGAADAIAADAADAAPAEAEEVEMAEAEAEPEAVTVVAAAELPLPPAAEGVEGERV